MPTTSRLLFFAIIVSTSTVAQASVEIFTAIRQAQSIEHGAAIESAAVSYIQSSESSTPLNGGAAGAPAAAIIEFRDLVASRPITVVRLQKSIKVHDKSGTRGEPPLNIVDISIIDVGDDQLRVFAYTEGFGNLVEFRNPSKDTLDHLQALLKKHRAQDTDTEKPAAPANSEPEASTKAHPKSQVPSREPMP